MLAQYPEWVGKRVVNHLVLVEEWLPSIASVRKRCEEDIGPLRRAAEWEKAATTTKLAGPPRLPRPTYEELQAKYGLNWGIEQDKRNRPPTREEALAKLKAEFGEALVDACPDVPSLPTIGELAVKVLRP